jgi:uncharacterized RDD family membrane protein YckC
MELARQGKISSGTMVWNEIIAEWRPYGASTDIPAGTSSQIGPPANQQDNPALNTGSSSQLVSDAPTDSFAPSGPESYCSQCFRKFPNEDLIHYGDMTVCAECKPLFFQKLREGSSVGASFRYAGFWIRFVAVFIDGLIGWIVGTLIMLAVGLPILGPDPASIKLSSFWTIYILVNLLQWGFAISYETFFIGKYGATPGKMALGLKVITPDGGRVSYIKAFGRYFAKIISGLLLLIGYIMAAFDEEKRALHDRICGTRVIRK